VPQKVLARQSTRQESANTVPKAGRVGVGTSSVSSTRVLLIVAAMPVGQVREGMHEVPTEDAVQL
jgi:hypothetical protein